MKTSQFILAIFLTVILPCCTVDKSKLLGDDYRLFQDTPAWELAKAVRDGDLKDIERLVKGGINVDFREERFGQTLLMLAVNNLQYQSCKKLLALGANPNEHDTYDGTSAMIEAANVETQSAMDTTFLKLMLLNGGNANDEEVGVRREGNSTRNTPLLVACRGSSGTYRLEKVKMLVRHGADVNHRNEFEATPIGEAVIQSHLDVVLFLLQHGADYNVVIFNWNGHDYYLCDELRKKLMPIGSREHQEKMAIVDFLKTKGIDYFKTPVPDWVVKTIKKEYPKGWKKYLERY